MGTTALNTGAALRATGRTVTAVDVRPSGESGIVGTAERRIGTNLFHLNPDWLERFFAQRSRSPLHVATRLNACVPFWELPNVSPEWVATLNCMDAVLAPSRFVADALASSGLVTPIVHYPQAVFIPEGVHWDRPRFGIEDTVVAFALSFAAASFVDRKNPWGAIEAFTRAFRGRDDVRLYVRVHEHPGYEDHALIQRLRMRSASDPRIVLVEGGLDYAGVLSLYASCDAYISLHRSEGLGLGPMEAMSLGKPVVATGWSGNMDFMTSDNSFPIAYSLVSAELDPGSPYGPSIAERGSTWAEPDLDDAAQAMARVANDPSLRTAIGTKASDDMERRRALFCRAHPFDVLEANRQQWGPGSVPHKSAATRLRGLERSARRQSETSVTAGAKRLAVDFLRTIHLKAPDPRHS
jgi:glycosyltransferase involved in cell wall biosynthesis